MHGINIVRNGNDIEEVVSQVIRWARNPYLGKGIEEVKEIRSKVNKGAFLSGIFLVTLSDHPEHLMEIIPAWMLMQKWNRRVCPKIVGITKGKKDAMKMVAEIVQEVYENTGAVDIKEYLKKR